MTTTACSSRFHSFAKRLLARIPELQEELHAKLQELLDTYTGERSSWPVSLSFSGTAQAGGSGIELAIDEEDWQLELRWMLG